MAGKGGGAWKVAYADFVTAMMAFFLVMWIVAQNKPAVNQAIAGYFRDPFGSSSRPSGAPSISPNRKSEDPPNHRGPGKNTRERGRGPGEPDPTKQPDDPDSKNVGIRKPSLLVLHDGENPNTGTTVAFAGERVDLDDRGKDRLNELLPTLRGKPNKIEIRGHSIGRSQSPDASPHDSWKLSYDRCLATMKYLEEKGIEAERFRLSQAGSHEPHTLKVEPGWQTQNSRVEVYMLGEYVDSYKGTRKERSKRFVAKSDEGEAKSE